MVLKKTFKSYNSFFYYQKTRFEFGFEYFDYFQIQIQVIQPYLLILKKKKKKKKKNQLYLLELCNCYPPKLSTLHGS